MKEFPMTGEALRVPDSEHRKGELYTIYRRLGWLNTRTWREIRENDARWCADGFASGLGGDAPSCFMKQILAKMFDNVSRQEQPQVGVRRTVLQMPGIELASFRRIGPCLFEVLVPQQRRPFLLS